MSRFVVEVHEWRVLDVSPDEVLGLTEAARRLGLGELGRLADQARRSTLRARHLRAEPPASRGAFS